MQLSPEAACKYIIRHETLWRRSQHGMLHCVRREFRKRYFKLEKSRLGKIHVGNGRAAWNIGILALRAMETNKKNPGLVESHSVALVLGSMAWTLDNISDREHPTGHTALRPGDIRGFSYMNSFFSSFAGTIMERLSPLGYTDFLLRWLVEDVWLQDGPISWRSSFKDAVGSVWRPCQAWLGLVESFGNCWNQLSKLGDPDSLLEKQHQWRQRLERSETGQPFYVDNYRETESQTGEDEQMMNQSDRLQEAQSQSGQYQNLLSYGMLMVILVLFLLSKSNPKEIPGHNPG